MANDLVVPPETATEQQLLLDLRNRMILLEEKVNNMAQGFVDLRDAVQSIGGEGGEMEQVRDAVLAAIAALQNQTAVVQRSANTILAQFTAAGQEAGAEAQTLLQTKSQLDAVEQALQEAADAANPPAPTPEPTPESPAPIP